MPYENTTKEGWVHNLLSALRPKFEELGFKRSGKTKYTKTIGGVEFRYLISMRHPRYSDDPHQLYINPCLHVYFPDLERIHSRIIGKQLNRDFPTLGGSLGLYKSEGHSEEWPIDSDESAQALLPQLERDIDEVALPFWDALSNGSKVLEAIETKAVWAKRSDSWKYREIVLLFLERGIDAAMAFLLKNSKRFRDIDPNTLKDQLQEVKRK
jgi:hypothetical protein